jgi:hypothetical protein
MKRRRLWRGLSLLLAGLVLAAPLLAQNAPRPAAPAKQGGLRLEAVAETRLIMEGLTNANYRGLDRLLKQRPADVETWVFARGQALLIAESGNLLLLRPPRNQGEKVWMQLSADLRDDAATLARALAARDYTRTVTSFHTLTASCNRCHQTFRVPQRIAPSAEPGTRRDVE